jgi:hypothetical protein
MLVAFGAAANHCATASCLTRSRLDSGVGQLNLAWCAGVPQPRLSAGVGLPA